MAQRTMGTRSLIGPALSANRKRDSHSSVFRSRVARSGLTIHTVCLDIRSRVREPSPRWCARRRLVSARCRQEGGANRASDPLPALPNARTSAALATVTHHHLPTRVFVSALVRLDLLRLSPADATQF